MVWGRKGGNRYKGGVGILVGEEYLATEVRVNKPKGKGVESVWLNVKGRGMPNTLVGVLYITPQVRVLEGFQKQALEFCRKNKGRG